MKFAKIFVYCEFFAHFVLFASLRQNFNKTELLKVCIVQGKETVKIAEGSRLSVK